MNIYAGIGSRKTPALILADMRSIAKQLDAEGITLRSGGAVGADSAFRAGSRHMQIFRPEDVTPEAIKLASTFHPAWHKCGEGARALHGRNMQIILGQDLSRPVELVICWTPGGENVGGTATALACARAYGVPIWNLAKTAMPRPLGRLMLRDGIDLAGQ